MDVPQYRPDFTGFQSWWWMAKSGILLDPPATIENVVSAIRALIDDKTEYASNAIGSLETLPRQPNAKHP